MRIIVIPVNDPPVPQARISPLAEFPGVTNLIVIAPNGTDAIVVLDGSQSFDVDDDTLGYVWLEGVTPLASGVIATNPFGPGRHLIALRVSDGIEPRTTAVDFDVITPAEATGIVAATVLASDLATGRRMPLLASLNAAATAFDGADFGSGIHHLLTVQRKAQQQVAPSNPALAAQITSTVQVIINALEN